MFCGNGNSRGRTLHTRAVPTRPGGIWPTSKASSSGLEEAATAFDDDLAAYYPDSLHAGRFILIGYSRRQRLLYVVHAEVQQDVIRIISARRATSHEKAHYEND